MRLNKIIDIIFSFFVFIISLITKNSNVWLFGSQGGYSYSDNSKYFFEWILNNYKDQVCYWVTKDKKIYNTLLDNKIPVIYFYNFKSIVLVARAKYIVCTHSHIGNDVCKFVSKDKFLITLWHGIPLKKLGVARKRNYRKYLYIKNEPDIFLVTSKRDAELFSGLYHIGIDKFFIGTYPRVNNLISIAENERMILYAPTFRDRMGQDYYNEKIFPCMSELEKLNRILLKFDYKFVIKLHPYIDANFPNLINFSNIEIVLPYEDIQTVLCKAAILITDYSSVYFDYLNLDREIIFFIPDYSWYYQDENRGFIYNYEEVTPGVKVSNWSELRKCLLSKFSGDDVVSFSKSRREVLDFFYTRRDLNNADLFNKCKEKTASGLKYKT
ncbi:CDP-glycerol glycerophosphotransferase family protein [Desulfoplanes sp. PS50]